MKLKNLSILVLLAALTFSFAACGSDDDDDIVGVWEFDPTFQSAIAVTVNPKIAPAMVKQIVEKFGSTEIYTIEFKKDGTFIDGDGYKGTYLYKKNILTLTFPKFGSGTYSIPMEAGTSSHDANTLHIIHSCKDEYLNEDGSIDKNGRLVTDLFTDYASELEGLTADDLTSITVASLTSTFTRK